jgi:hypothetical protein
LTSAAGDQSENRDDGGGIIILAKKGLSLFGVCLFLGVRNSRQNKKIGKGARQKKNKMEGTNGPDPLPTYHLLPPTPKNVG